jgi:nucleoside phosphorylase/predicted nucleotidyltransferase
MYEPETINLHQVVADFVERAPAIVRVHLFGSRRYKTGSPRSDIDLLVEINGARPSDRQLAEAIRRVNVYIDAFVISGDTARSVINGSIISASPGKTMCETLDAVPIWSESAGITDQDHADQVILGDWTPVYTIAAEHGDPAATRRPIDYLILTALSDEFVAMQAALKPYLVATRDIGTFGQHLEAHIPHAMPGDEEIAIVCQSDRMGNVASALTAAEALALWGPRLVVLTGLTAGVRGRARIGDIIVATHVFDYESGKVTWRGVAPHGVKFNASFSARQRLLSAPDLKEAVAAAAEVAEMPTSSELREGAYASGEKVVAHRRLARKVSRHDRKITAIEMESLGVADACRRQGAEFMVLKAVTDLADRRKSDDLRIQCCDFATDLLARALRARYLLPPRRSASSLAATVERATRESG